MLEKGIVIVGHVIAGNTKARRLDRVSAACRHNPSAAIRASRPLRSLRGKELLSAAVARHDMLNLLNFRDALD